MTADLGINAKVAVLEVLAEEDAMRPPNFFEEKKKQVKIQQDPTVKKMQKQANKKGISRAQYVDSLFISSIEQGVCVCWKGSGKLALIAVAASLY